MTALKRALASLFNIRAGEGRITSLLFIHSFCLGLATVSFSTAANALFLSAFDVGTLPYVYIGSAGLAVVIGLIYTRLQSRVSFPTLLVMTLVFLLMTVVAFRIGLAVTSTKWLIFALLFWLRLVIVLANLEFWGLAGRLYNVRQGKRLFSLVGSGELSANILGGFATPAFVMFFGTPHLLTVAVIGLGFALGILGLIIRGARESLTTTPETRAQRPRPPNRLIQSLKHPYTLMIILSNAFMIIVYSFIDFTFYDYTQSRYQDDMHLAMFIGPFFAIVQVINVLTKTLLASRLFNRYGLTFGLLFHPALLIVLSLGITVTYYGFGMVGVLFWMVAAMKLCDEVLWTSVYDPSLLILYQPLPAERRRAVQVAVQSVFGPLAIGVSGAILLALGARETFASVQLTVVMPVLLVAAMVIAWLVNREYPKTLTQALAKRNLTDVDFSLQDGPSLAVVQAKLKSQNPLEIRYALELLERSEHDTLVATLTKLLSHASDDVRLYVVQGLERCRAVTAYPAVEARLAVEHNPTVKAAVLRTVCALGEAEVVEAIVPYLDDPLTEIWQAAMIGLLRDGGISGVLVAGERLMRLVRSPEVSERVASAQVLKAVGQPGFYQPVSMLLHDSEEQVCEAALAAVETVRHPKLWPIVIDFLTAPRVKVSLKNRAACALEVGGKAVLPDVAKILSQYELDRDTRRRLLSVCGQIGDSGALELLKSALPESDPEVRQAVLVALSMCEYQALRDERIVMQRYAELEGAEACWLLAALADIGADDAVALLRDALSQNLDQLNRRLFLLASFVTEEQALRRAWEAFCHPTAEKRAYALEIVDVLVPEQLKTIMLPLIEDLSAEERLRRLHDRFPQRRLECVSRLYDMIAQPELRVTPWTRACAVYTLVKLSALSDVQVVEPALMSSDPLVRETASWAMETLTNKGVATGMALMPIEKVIILKSVPIFAETPDEVLAEVATILEEVDYTSGDCIFEKGTIGDCMFVIIEGRVRVHEGERTLVELGERQIFGELAVLDPEPRSASVTAIEPTRLFCLHQDAFYDLMAHRIEIARGIIRALCQDLRSRTTSAT